MESCIICHEPTYQMNDSKQTIHDSCMANYHAYNKDNMDKDPRYKAVEQINIDIENLKNQKRELMSQIEQDFERLGY